MHSVADDFDSAGVKIHFAVYRNQNQPATSLSLSLSAPKGGEGRGREALRVEGERAPVILIHGLYANGRMNWDATGITALLAKHFQVITLDCRGHGRSGKPQAEDAYGTNMVEDVVRLMNHLHIKTASVAGYSMGAMIALKLAVTHPARVNRLVLGGMGWINADVSMKSVWDKTDRTRFTVPPACVQSFPKFAITESKIKAVKIPVDIIIGEEDPCRQWYVAPLHLVRPDWPVHVIAGADHLNCLSNPKFKTQLEAALLKP